MKLISIGAGLSALVLARAAMAATINVPQDYPTIQAGIDAAASGDTVLVAPGTYQELIDFKGKAITVKSSGGRDVTIIDGHQRAPVVTFAAGEGRDSVLEGFTIVNGEQDPPGAGIFCSGSSPTIRLNEIRHNFSWGSFEGGGGLSCDASPLIERNRFVDNEGTLGGAIQCAGPAVILGNFFSDNSGNKGGAIYNEGTALIEENVIDGNGAWLGGGGIFSKGDSIIRSNIIHHNWAANSAGGLSCSNDTIDHNTITGNTAEAEGGIGAGAATITNNVILYNFSSYEGGGIYGGDLIMNNVISYNTAAEGSGIYGGRLVVNNLVHHNVISGGPEGGAISGSETVVNTTIADNWSRPHGYGGHVGGYLGNGTLVNCILWHNTPDEIGGSPTITYSDVQGGWPGIGNIDAFPRFADWSTADRELIAQDGHEYSLLAMSPCIDAGDPTTTSCDQDLAGNPRQLDGHLSGHATVDMGAIELDHVHLEVAGKTAPGSTLTIVTVGTPGLQVLLLAGLVPGTTCAPPYGALYFSLSGGWTSAPWGVIPSVTSVTIPPDVTVPLQVVLQEIALDGTGLAGNTSNPVTLIIQ